MLRTPKERFLESEYSGKWGKIASTAECEEAVHSALAQFANELTIDCAVPQQACDAHQQMIGARKYMEILCTLHVPETTPKSHQTKSLDYGSGV